MTHDATTAFARTIVDEWMRAGVTDAVLAPGSRSAPLALAVARDERCRVHVHIDERSAAGFALGLGRASRRPPVLLSTSGTAAALFHGAVLEAHHGRVPLLVCTADRPPELRDVGAGQTVEQHGLYGGALRWAHDPGPPDDAPGAAARWRQLACRAAALATGPPAGPVHLNLPFRDPLVPSGAPLVDAPGREDGAPWVATRRSLRAPDDAVIAELAAFVRAHPRGVVVAGWSPGATAPVVGRFAAAAGWPLLADPISGVRSGPDAVSTYEALLRAPGFPDQHRPEAVLRLGGPPTSKVLDAWISGVPTWLVDPDDAWLDPDRSASTRVVCDAEALLDRASDALDTEPGAGCDWSSEWKRAEAIARGALDEACDALTEPFEGRVARDVVACLPDGATLVVASSMPVRDVDAFAAPRRGIELLANRGVNGIDGFVSTVLGVAAARRGAPVAGLLGDLCLLHDVNGLVGASSRGIDATLVVLDNDGGGIFSFLPQARSDAVSPSDFELLFGTPHGIDIEQVARAYGVPCARVRCGDAVARAVESALDAGGVRIVLVESDRAANAARHAAVWEAVSSALR
ncbi:MAG TPA: 2-succinyl-5-enolpyruvyl-6-hydroxy-3-cyclohexene-1-carboxylic-acid synthase [Acidimicrobiia bacterium]